VQKCGECNGETAGNHGSEVGGTFTPVMTGKTSDFDGGYDEYDGDFASKMKMDSLRGAAHKVVPPSCSIPWCVKPINKRYR